MTNLSHANRRIGSISKSVFLTASVLALTCSITSEWAQAQSAPNAASLPPVTVTAPDARRRAPSPASRTRNAARSRRTQTARRPETTAEPKPFAPSQDARTGTVGYYANSTSVATKSNTPIINIPQSMSVITKDFIRDQGFGGMLPASFRAWPSIRAKAIATNS